MKMITSSERIDMKKEEIKKLCDEINNNFCEPFTDIKVRAKVNDDGGFSLYIGPRDVQFDKNCNVVGTGTILDY